MSQSAYLSGRLPDGEANGLAGKLRELVDDPERVHVLIVLADVTKVTQLVESGATVPTLRIRRVEAIGDPTDQKELQRILMREYERRTGQPVLPLELERDVESAFTAGDAAAPPDDDPPPPPKRSRKRS